MKNRFTAGFLLMTSAVTACLLVTRAGESFGLESKNAGNSFTVLLDEVLENNPELQFYEAEILAAQGLRETAGLWNNPELSGSIGHKSVRSTSEAGGTSTAGGAASEIAVTQSLEWPGRIHLRKAIAERDIELAELSLEQFRGHLKARVKMAAYALSAAQEKTEATQEVAEHFRVLHEVLIQRDQAGLAPLLEARVIEALELNMQRKASQAALEAKAALYDLNQLRGAGPDDTLKLVRTNLTFRPIEMDKNELVKLAVSNDFKVRLRALELERQGYQVKLAKNERFPAITAGPAIAMERAGDRERIIGAVISLPLPLWNRNQGKITTAKAQQSQAETSFEVAERDAERRVMQAITTYETKFKEMAHWRPDSIKHFKEAAELADRHYRLGAVPVSTYIELQTQYLETLSGLQETRKEALETAVELELMAGVDLSLTETNLGDAQ